jgi:hypothetical protein
MTAMGDPRCMVVDDALSAVKLQALTDAVLASPGLGDSQLAGTFAHTRGFGLIFRARERAALLEHNPWARPFVELALAHAPDDANAWYLNALLVPPGGAVGLHYDGTLREPSGEADALARRVTVLCLRAGDGAGGALRLLHDDELVREIAPRAGRFVSFDGALAHEVTAREARAQRPRLSLVVEHYALTPGALARLAPRLVAGPGAAVAAELWQGARPQAFSEALRRRQRSAAGGVCSTP